MPHPWNSRDAPLGLELRDADPDHWADIRHLHALSFRHLTGPSLDPHQTTELVGRIYEPDYSLMLQAQDLLVAWIDRQIVGTAGWVPFDGRGVTARITSVSVSPLFTRLGVGRRLVEATEAKASLAGYQDFAVRVFPPSAGFFETLGYARSAQGVQSLGAEGELPVVFMRKSHPSHTKSSPETVAAARSTRRS